jgi:hypothetical protein
MRIWTEAGARAILPELRQLLGVLQRAAAAAGGHRGNGHGPQVGDDPAHALSEVEGLGVVLRDPSTGLIDFATTGPGGETYFLCFRLDDDDLAWWHRPEEGVAGRKRLPYDPKAPGIPLSGETQA